MKTEWSNPKKIICCLISAILFWVSLTFIVSASEDDYVMKEFDKGYITFVFDDNNSMFTNDCYQLFKQYDMPMCCAVIAKQVENSPFLISLLKDVESSGGEILSHTYDHTAFTDSSSLETVEYQLSQSFIVLRSLGFNVNGVIEAGNGGGEKTADYEMIETVTRKYYKYSNAYGVTTQYKKQRTWLNNYDVNSIKTLIDKTIAEKNWVVFSAHNEKEIPLDNLKEILTYIREKGEQNIKVVNWNYIYANFGEYTGPQVPTQEALSTVDEYIKNKETTQNNRSENFDNSQSSFDNQQSSKENFDNNTINANTNESNNETIGSHKENKSSKIALFSIIIVAMVLICIAAFFFTVKYLRK